MGNGGKKGGGTGGIIDLATIMVESVADYEIIDTEDDVVAEDLTENFACNGNIGCLVLDYHTGRKRGVVKNGVATSGTSVEGYAYLIGQKSGRITEMTDEVMDKMLAYPFFGSEGNIFLPQNIEHLFLAAYIGNFKRR